jgi:hypothetical protein
MSKSKNIVPVESNISFFSPSFSKSSFFSSKDGVKVLFRGSDFENLVLTEISDIVPALKGVCSSFILKREMFDRSTRSKAGKNILTPNEWCAMTRALILKQGNGESGSLLSNGKWNVSYVRLENKIIIPVLTTWNDGASGWDLDSISCNQWPANCQIFSVNSLASSSLP